MLRSGVQDHGGAPATGGGATREAGEEREFFYTDYTRNKEKGVII